MAGLLSTGRDTYCLDAYAPGRTVTGAELLGQRCYHRLITPQGTLRGGEDEANFGLDVAGFVGRTDPTTVDSMLPVMVRNELLKDPTVDAVTVKGSRTEDAGLVSWVLTISVTGTDVEVDLIVAVSDVTVALLGMN